MDQIWMVWLEYGEDIAPVMFRRQGAARKLLQEMCKRDHAERDGLRNFQHSENTHYCGVTAYRLV